MNPNSRLSGKLYGVTHDLDGTPRITEPHVIKVSIGLARGKAIHVYIDKQGRWVIQTGYGNETRRIRFETKEEAQKEYFQLKSKVPERKYPERLPYFTFSRPAPSGEYEPDFDVIEAHGPLPTEIEIAFIWDEPFETEFQFWTASELKCKGDGRDALRINSAAQTVSEKRLVAQAEETGEKYFLIREGCSEFGCPHCHPVDGKPSLCRPLGDLKFQLLNSPRLGGTAFYQTTGYRSIKQIFSAIQTFKRIAGPYGHITQKQLIMTLMSYRVKHNGRNITQYSVNIEFRQQNAVEARRAFYEPDLPPPLEEPEALRQLEASASNAAAIEAEFGLGTGDNEPPDPEPDPPGQELEVPDVSRESALPLDSDSSVQDGSGSESNNEVDHLASPRNSNIDPLPATNNKASKPEINTFYNLCRSRGMTDVIIADKLGSMGFETLSEITETALPQLMAWANEFKPDTRQGSLI